MSSYFDGPKSEDHDDEARECQCETCREIKCTECDGFGQRYEEAEGSCPRCGGKGYTGRRPVSREGQDDPAQDKCSCGEWLHTEFERQQGACVGCDDSQV